MLWKVKVTVIQIVVDAFAIVLKGFERKRKEEEIKGRNDIIHISALLRSVIMLRRVLES